MNIPADTTFIADLTIEVEDEDSLEVMDAKIIQASGDDTEMYEELCEMANLGQVFGLDDEGILIAPEPGVYVYTVAVNASTETYTPLKNRQLSDEEAAACYTEIDLPDAF